MIASFLGTELLDELLFLSPAGDPEAAVHYGDCLGMLRTSYRPRPQAGVAVLPPAAHARPTPQANPEPAVDFVAAFLARPPLSQPSAPKTAAPARVPDRSRAA